MKTPKVVSREDWLAARQALLAKEKEFIHMRDRLSAERRELPCVKVDKDYRFQGPQGAESLADLFAGRGQLIVYHFMFSPDWEEGCPSCSFLADGFDGVEVHLQHRDATLVVVSRAPLDRLEAYKKRMGWRCKWVSSLGSDFNRDFHVSFDEAELAAGEVYYNYKKTTFPMAEAPGLSVFCKDDEGDVYHSYSTYARGLDALINSYQYLDLLPKGRDEDDLDYTMAWVRRHDQYED